MAPSGGVDELGAVDPDRRAIEPRVCRADAGRRELDGDAAGHGPPRFGLAAGRDGNDVGAGGAAHGWEYMVTVIVIDVGFRAMSNERAAVDS